jgi:hypothetical protein
VLLVRNRKRSLQQGADALIVCCPSAGETRPTEKPLDPIAEKAAAAIGTPSSATDAPPGTTMLAKANSNSVGAVTTYRV